jgi:hypothetical protein
MHAAHSGLFGVCWGPVYPVRWRGQDGLLVWENGSIGAGFLPAERPGYRIDNRAFVRYALRQTAWTEKLFVRGPAAEQPAGRTPGRHEHGRPARVARGVRWPSTAERCQHIVGVGVGYFPTAATNGFYRYTRSRTPWVQVDHHRRTRKALGNWRQARRRKRERTGTCAVRPGRLRLYEPS